jgi:hypothetical protein
VLYRETLGSNPINADALHLLGVIAHQRGDHMDAIGLMRREIWSDSFSFRNGFRNQQLNVTLFFGDRGRAVRAEYLHS